MRVLVCGGRDFDDTQLLWQQLDNYHHDNNITQVIEGGQAGADTLARTWALSNNIQVHEFEADWKKYGRAAGPIRNQRMLDEGKPDVVIAFPGHIGTANMINKAKKAGVPVEIVS